MKNILVDNKSEAHLIKYLKSLPDNRIKQFYDAVEWTPYPVLVIKEFQRRFQPNDDEFVDKLLESIGEAKEKVWGTVLFLDIIEDGKEKKFQFSVVQDWVKYPISAPTKFLKVDWSEFVKYIKDRQIVMK